MWISVVTAIVSAAAALAGAVLNDRLSGKRQTSNAMQQREEADRRDFLNACTELLSVSGSVRHHCLTQVTEIDGSQHTREELLQTLRDADLVVTRMRLLSKRFETLHQAYRLVADLRRLTTDAYGGHPARKQVVTLMAAATRMAEENLVTLVRDEIGLPEPGGLPKPDPEVALRAIAKRVTTSQQETDKLVEALRAARVDDDTYWQ